MKNHYRREPNAAAKSTKTKVAARRIAGRGKGKPMQPEHTQNVKERQSIKIKELSDAMVAAGFVSLDEQATALGLSRSTTWTILKAKHKNYGLSGALINRILQKPGLHRRVRTKILEYVEEKASGSYGHNNIQLRRFRERLRISGSEPDCVREDDHRAQRYHERDGSRSQ
ncbi:MAG: hypothetical protein KGL62_07460 [Bradyrhizobium sp.]|uniref:hypothetical protein n=1 Tax=Bradyrhizobium sp. TaxID=376 RepID=UPI00238C2A59|nr:hypothetical protein [Bradyrhizobium sp.]MDE2602192.1 hypothetical protein [Bradyrhizobium sp.]